MADPLTKLSSKYKCDKSDKNHRYTPLYNNLFEELRNEKFTFIEFGYGVGNSCKMWMEYFNKAKMICIDNGPNPTDDLIRKYIKEGRIEYLSSDQIDKEKIKKNVLNKYKEFPFIIDDASHVPEDQQFTLSFCFPYISKGGYYIIEDLKCRRNHSVRFKTQSDKTLITLENFNKTNIFNSKILSVEDNKFLTENIDNIFIQDKITFIKRKK